MAHFINVNQDEQVFKLQYADMVRRCDESERKVAFIIQQCKIHDIHLNKIDSVESMGEVLKDVARERQVSLETLFESVEKEVNEIQEFILQQTEGSKQMKDDSNHLIEYYTVLKKAGMMIFGQAAVDVNRLSLSAPEDELLA